MTVKRERFSLCEFPPMGHYRLREGLELAQAFVERDNNLACSRHFLADHDEYATPSSKKMTLQATRGLRPCNAAR